MDEHRQDCRAGRTGAYQRVHKRGFHKRFVWFGEVVNVHLPVAGGDQLLDDQLLEAGKTTPYQAVVACSMERSKHATGCLRPQSWR